VQLHSLTDLGCERVCCVQEEPTQQAAEAAEAVEAEPAETPAGSEPAAHQEAVEAPPAEERAAAGGAGGTAAFLGRGRCSRSRHPLHTQLTAGVVQSGGECEGRRRGGGGGEGQRYACSLIPLI
jgi:hypothetical protein